MFKRGQVSEVDAASGRARVTLLGEGGAGSYWLEVLVPNAGTNEDQVWPDVGDTVAVLLDDAGESGVVLGGFFNGKKRPTAANGEVRRVRFSDGAIIEYDRANHQLSITISGDVSLSVNSVTIGGGAEAVALAGKVTEQLQALANAIAGAVPIAQDGGIALQQGIVGALGGWPGDIAAEKLTTD